jgi:hypothetical protein
MSDSGVSSEANTRRRHYTTCQELQDPPPQISYSEFERCLHQKDQCKEQDLQQHAAAFLLQSLRQVASKSGGAGEAKFRGPVA